MTEWGNEWEITCIRIRIMMIKRGIVSIPITCEKNPLEVWTAAMEKTMRDWREWNKKKTTA